MQASSVAIDGSAILLIGPSGSGKSDLCLRLIDRGGELVSDDFVELTLQAGQVVVSAPTAIRGLLEIRGLGIMRMPYVDRMPLKMVFRLKDPKETERLPEPAHMEVCGERILVFDIYAFAASAPVLIFTALSSQPEDFIE